MQAKPQRLSAGPHRLERLSYVYSWAKKPVTADKRILSLFSNCRLRMSSDPSDKSDGGYTPDFLSFKHGLTLEEARKLIERFGASRKALDAAAARLKKGKTFSDED
jgi:hypothetical protein